MRHIHALGYTESFARYHRAENAVGKHDARNLVCHAVDVVGNAVVGARPPQRPCASLACQGESRLAGIIAFGAIACRRGVNQGRVQLRQVFVAQPKALRHTLAEILHKDVRFLHEFQHHFQTLRMLKVERDALLVAVQALKVCAATFKRVRHSCDCGELPAVVSVQRLDLDDIRAKIGEHHRGDWPELPHRPVDDAHA